MFKKFVLVVFILGIGLFITGVIIANGDFNVLKSALVIDDEYEAKVVNGEEVVTGVEIDLKDNNVVFFYSEDDTYSVDFFESIDDKINVSVVDGKLVLKGVYSVKYRWFKLAIKSSAVKQVNIHLPQSFAGSIKANLTSGNTAIENFELDSLNMDLTSGNVSLRNTNMTNIDIDSTSGNINLNRVNANKVSIDNTSGKITIDEVNIANEAKLNFTSGNLDITNSQINNLDIDLTSGSTNLRALHSDNISVDFTSGDVYIDIIGDESEYRSEFDITFGCVTYMGNSISSAVINDNASKHIYVNGTSGDIEINFTNE